MVVQDNTFCNNSAAAGQGAAIAAWWTRTASGNNFVNSSSEYLVDLNNSEGFTATGNWWGTTDGATIAQRIYDFSDDFNLGEVTYTPFLTSPNQGAPPLDEC